MKLTKKILKSLPEGLYNVLITKVSDVPKTEANAALPTMRQIEFKVVDHPEHSGRLIIWPKRADFLYKHLTNKAGLEELTDDEELVNKTIELSFQHSYIDSTTGEVKFNEQWSIY